MSPLPHRIILVRPEHPENIGFSARAMKSCGLQRLVFVGSDLPDLEQAKTTAVWSHDLLARAMTHPTLLAALEANRPRAAFTARTSGKRARRVHSLEEWADEVASSGRACDLVFGPESRGLESAEVDLCDWAVSIPTHPDQPSLNLSHAVQLAVYALYRRQTSPKESVLERQKAQDWAKTLVESAKSVGLFPWKGSEEAVTVLTRLFLRASPNAWESAWLEKQARDFWGSVSTAGKATRNDGKA